MQASVLRLIRGFCSDAAKAAARYSSLLHACAYSRDLSQAKLIHESLVKNAELQENIYVLNQLIDVYAMCGSPADSRRVFNSIKNPNAESWNSVLRAYSSHNCFEKTIELFQEMVRLRRIPDEFTLPSVLKACAGLEFLKQGRAIHGFIMHHGLESDTRISNALVNMYAKCHCLEDARQVFDAMAEPDVVSWNIMISGCSSNSSNLEALNFFSSMLVAGKRPNSITVATILPVCVELQAMHFAMRVHGYCIKCGLVSVVLVGNALVNAYAKFGRLEDSHLFFEEIEGNRDCVSWNSLIAGYVQSARWDKATELFRRMLQVGVMPNEVSVITALSVCARKTNLQNGMEIHNYVARKGLFCHPNVGNSLVNMYSKCGNVDFAERVFDNIQEKDVISWNAMISGYTQNGYAESALRLFRCAIHQDSLQPDFVTLSSVLTACCRVGYFCKGMEIHSYIARKQDMGMMGVSVSNALVTFYAYFGRVQAAFRIFCSIPRAETVSWNAMLSACIRNDFRREAIHLFSKMVIEAVPPDGVTIQSILSCCAELGNLKLGKEIHAFVVKQQTPNYDPAVGISIIDMYAKCCRIMDAERFLNRMSCVTISTQNAMISFYGRCGDYEAAQRIFDNMKIRNLSSWNAIISMHSSNGTHSEALRYFHLMQWTGQDLDTITIASVLPACAQLAALEHCREIHCCTVKKGLGFLSDAFMASAMIDAYAKCGSLHDAIHVFEQTTKRDVVTWTAMIFAYGIHGKWEDALATFRQMRKLGLEPDYVTFTALLCTCSHGGLVDEGLEYFSFMIHECGMVPKNEHYACLVDLFGRAGRLDDAYQFIDNMPIEPPSNVWDALLAACMNHGNVLLAELITNRLSKQNPLNIDIHATVPNVNAADDSWDNAEKVRNAMDDIELYKTPECSWIHLNNEVHKFFGVNLPISPSGTEGAAISTVL